MRQFERSMLNAPLDGCHRILDLGGKPAFWAACETSGSVTIANLTLDQDVVTHSRPIVRSTRTGPSATTVPEVGALNGDGT